MSKPSTKPHPRCTSVVFIEIECPDPIVPRLVISILIESSRFSPRLRLH